MSGDVFGNGLLVSPMTRLVAAFDHRHIFLDPDPPPDAIEERRRLFRLPRSSWADYATARISAGGGVFPRSAKMIALSPQARALLGISAERVEPAEVMRAILKARVDLLYFGGIGTYVKAGTETQAEAGDRANDALRINGSEIRAQVVGEGANLGVTQAGRIEAARGGVRINTDALDNSAGVSTSDHEVNIKILLADVLAGGEITERQRVDLLEAMTDDVAALVLRDNHEQSRAVSLDALAGAADLPTQDALMAVLEGARVLDRAVAGLPDTAAIAARAAAGTGLTRPEICTLLAHAKLWLSQALDASDLAEDPALEPALVAYFPPALRERFAAHIARHRLRRELIGTHVTNELINRLGHAAFARLVVDTGATPVMAARAALVVRAAFDLDAVWAQVDAAERGAPADALLAALATVRAVHEAASRALVGEAGGIADGVAALRPGVRHLLEHERLLAAGGPAVAGWLARGLPEDLALTIAALPALIPAPHIVRLADRQAGLADAAGTWRQVGEVFATERLRAAVATAPAAGAWARRAAAALQDEVASIQAGLARRVLAEGLEARALLDALGEAGARAVRVAQQAAAANDLAAVTVAARGLRALG
jgi:glutamate dehydrogenase